MKTRKIFSFILALAVILTFSFGTVTPAEHVHASGEPTITVDSVDAKAGDTVTLNVTMANNPGIYGAEIYVHYDDKALTLTDAEDQGVFDNYKYSKNYKTGFMLLWDADSENMTGEGVVTVLTFKVNDNAKGGTHKVWIEYEEDCIFNDEWENVSFKTVAGGVTLPCNHVYTNYVSDKNATCTADGTKTAACDNGCGTKDTVADTGSMKGHKYTTYVSNNNAVCGVDGTKTATCDNGCGTKDTVVDTGSALKHSFTSYVSNNDATYTANGTETAMCDHNCGAKDTRVVAGSMLKDENAPTGEILVEANSFKEMVNKVTFGIFFKEAFDVTITGADAETGVKSVEYLKSEVAISAEDIVVATGWTTYAPFSVAEEGQYVIYAKITDNAGNIHYMSTDGLVLDVTSPVIAGVTSGAEYCEEVVVTVTEKHVASVTVNGQAVSLDANNQITLDAVSADGTEYTVVVTDKAGNEAKVTATVYAGHAFVNYVSDNNATCVADGTETAKCERCNETDTRTEVGSMGEHNFIAYVSNNDATCTADGTETASCAGGCGTTDTRTAVGSKLAHVYTSYVSNDNATCTTNCTETATCDLGCGTKDTRDIADTKVAHVYTNYVNDNNATCTADGTKTATCDFGCGAKDTLTVEGTMLAHVYTNYVSDNNATCTKDGTKTALCDLGCGEKSTLTDAGTMLAHKYTNYVSDNNATCVADGTKTAQCDYNCGNTDTVADPGSMGEHNFKNYVSNNDATCTKDGTETASCEGNCGTTDTRTAVGSKLAHVYTNYVSNDNATCTTNCTETATCDLGCGTKDTRDIADTKVAHVYTNYVNDNNATCTADGTKTATCDFGCGAKDTLTVEGTKLAHVYTNYVNNNDATCQKNATATAACDYGCGTKDTKEVPDSVVDHKYTNYVSNNDATCKVDGTKTALCDFGCGEKSTLTDAGSMLPHAVEAWTVTTAPTVDTFGEKEGICTACGDTIKAQIAKLIVSVESENGVKVEANGDVAFDADAELKADFVKEAITKDLLEQIEKQVDAVLDGKDVAEILDLSLLLGDVDIEFTGTVTVTIPLFSGADDYKDLQIAYMDANGKLTFVDSKVTSEGITFEASSMGTYIIVGTDTGSDSKPGTSSPVTGDFGGMLPAVLGLIVAIAVCAVCFNLKFRYRTR